MKLVEDTTRRWGRFNTTPMANPLDEFTGLKRLFEFFRTKEWVGFTISHPEFHCAMIIQDAKYLMSGELHIYDRATGEQNEYEGTGVGGRDKLTSDLLHASPRFQSRGFYLGYDFTDSNVKVSINMAAKGKTKACKAELLLDAAGSSHPLVVSAKLPNGGSMYTNKIIYPAGGYLQVGEKRYELDPRRDLMILDEHKSHLPYHTQWTWGTFAFPADGNFAGANFAARPQFAHQEEESGIWTPDEVEPLADITFNRQGDAALSPWHIYSADGRLDVTFTPEGIKEVKRNLGLAAIDYYQLCGRYKGTIRGANKTWTFEDIHGLCEQMDMRA